MIKIKLPITIFGAVYCKVLFKVLDKIKCTKLQYSIIRNIYIYEISLSIQFFVFASPSILTFFSFSYRYFFNKT